VTAIDSHAQDHSHGDGHGHGHSEYPFLAHHFDTPAQQFDSAKLGMWVFLATEILFFGALFAMYALMRAKEPEVFTYASTFLDTIMGGVNTVVLILSSLTMALAVRFAQTSKKGPLVLCLLLTLLGACGFLVIKYFEYTHKFKVNLEWGPYFYQPVLDEQGNPIGAPSAAPEAAVAAAVTGGAGLSQNPLLAKPLPAESSAIRNAPAGPAGLSSGDAAHGDAHGHGGDAAHGGGHDDAHAKHLKEAGHVFSEQLPVNTHRFFGIYYCMTGLHGIHVVVGMFLIGWITLRAMKGEFTSQYYTPVDMVGLYWHIVDLIWIFLFPLFYLIH
jgi:cytochrome c oxidase subunit 3